VEHPKLVGDRTTLAVIAGLRSAGYDVLLPFGENTRYDLVIDDDGRLSRVQCRIKGRLRFEWNRLATRRFDGSGQRLNIRWRS
jgi:hypothetical protein